MKIRRLMRLTENRPDLFVNDLEWAIADAIIDSPKLADNMPLLQVRTEHLVNTQAHFDVDKVAEYARKGITDGGIAIKRNGVVYILDGHHRTEAARKLDKATCWMRVIEMPASACDVDQWAKLLATSKTAIIRAMHPADRP